MAKIHHGVKTSRKQGGPKMAEIQYGVKPEIHKYAQSVVHGTVHERDRLKETQT